MYTSRENIEKYALIEINDDFDIDTWIEEMSRYIDMFTQRQFIADAQFSERLYNGTGTGSILVDDFVDLDSVAINDREVEDVVLYPANTLPKFTLRRAGGFQRGMQNISVIAKWGYSIEVPKDIEFACTVLVAGIVFGQNYGASAKTKEKIGNYDVAYNTDTQKRDYERAVRILNMHRRILL